jgi:hypothetical protein
MNPVKESYPDGLCPDCQEPIPDDVAEGESCANCDHAFFEETGVLIDGVPIERTVNCYFCGDFFDERECSPADAYNDNDGGVICDSCRRNKNEDEEIELQEYLYQKEGIAAIIFEPDDVGEEYERPDEETCHKIAEQILAFLT